MLEKTAPKAPHGIGLVPQGHQHCDKRARKGYRLSYEGGVSAASQRIAQHGDVLNLTFTLRPEYQQNRQSVGIQFCRAVLKVEQLLIKTSD